MSSPVKDNSDQLACRALLIATAILLPFENTGLQGTSLGAFGVSAAILPLSFYLLFLISRWAVSWPNQRIQLMFVLALVYMLIVSAIPLMVWGTESHGEYLITKGLKQFLMMIYVGLAFHLAMSCASGLKYAVPTALFIALAGVLLNDVLTLGAVVNSQLVHYVENTNLRPRGFSIESTTLGVQVTTLGLLAAYFSGSNIAKWLCLLFTVVVVAFAFTKGGIVALFAAAGITLVIFAKGLILWRGVVVIAVIALVAFFASVATDFVAVDIQDTTSIATRLVLAVAAVIIAFNTIFGVGLTGMLPALDRFGPDAVNLVSSVFPLPLIFVEVESYFSSSTAEFISLKSFFFDNLVFFGLPFAAAYFWFHSWLLKTLYLKGEWLLFLALTFCFIALTFYYSGYGYYCVPLVYAAALIRVRANENPLGRT